MPRPTTVPPPSAVPPMRLTERPSASRTEVPVPTDATRYRSAAGFCGRPSTSAIPVPHAANSFTRVASPSRSRPRPSAPPPVRPTRFGRARRSARTTSSSACDGCSAKRSDPRASRSASFASVAPTSTPAMVPVERAGWYVRALAGPRSRRGTPHVYRVLWAPRETVPAEPRSALPLPRRVAPRGARAPAVRHRAGRRLHLRDRRGGHGQDHAVPHAAASASVRARGGAHLQSAALARRSCSRRSACEFSLDIAARSTRAS